MTERFEEPVLIDMETTCSWPSSMQIDEINKEGLSKDNPEKKDLDIIDMECGGSVSEISLISEISDTDLEIDDITITKCS